MPVTPTDAPRTEALVERRTLNLEKCMSRSSRFWTRRDLLKKTHQCAQRAPHTMACAMSCLYVSAARGTCSSGRRVNVENRPAPSSPNPSSTLGRRASLGALLGVTVGAVLPFGDVDALALPLAPLGAVKAVGGEKRMNLPVNEVAKILESDLTKGQYFVTGNLTREVFDDKCRFKDPTNDVVGLSRYLTALGLLFDPKDSAVTLQNIEVTSLTTIETDGTLEGYLKFPWHPRVEPYTFHTIYTLDSQTGLIVEQSQTWSITGTKAIAETFTPT